MENLIVIEGKRKYQYNDFKSLIENFVCKNYFELSIEERKKELEKKTIANTFQTNTKIINFEKNKDNYSQDDFILYDEFTYILSLINIDKIVLLERTDANIFGKYINKENFKDNYIIINKFANEIMQKYLQNN